MEHKLIDHHDSPPMEYHAALERVGMDKVFLEELIQLYQTEFNRSWKEIREAIRNNDYVSIRMLAHSLKGSSANLGFSGLRDISMELENASKSLDLQSIKNKLALLRAEYKRVNTYLSHIQAGWTVP
jgi:HPt (histidine-containing phosphotransfer) domain-containing protein